MSDIDVLKIGRLSGKVQMVDAILQLPEFVKTYKTGKDGKLDKVVQE